QYGRLGRLLSHTRNSGRLENTRHMRHAPLQCQSVKATLHGEIVMFSHSMNFGLGEEIDQLRESVRRFAEERIAPLASEIDLKNDFPAHLWKEMGDMGLLGITVEPEFGGSGMSYLAHIVAVEEISRASASVGLSYGAHSNLCVNQIKRWGTHEQKRKYLPGLCAGTSVGALAMSETGAGSDVVSMQLKAERAGDHYRLSGSKMWITNGP